MTSFTAGTYKPVVVVTITEGSHPAVVARYTTLSILSKPNSNFCDLKTGDPLL